jgi:hypothetical protein
LKQILAITLLLIGVLFLFAACSYEIPYGKWQSRDPLITLDIGPRYGFYYFGEYARDKGTEDILIRFDFPDRGFYIYEYEASDFLNVNEDARSLAKAQYLLFYGSFKIKKGEMHYAVTEEFQDEAGREVIIFEKLEEYESFTETSTDRSGKYSHAVPYGKWQSQNPTIVLDINPMVASLTFDGTYTKDEHNFDVTISLTSEEIYNAVIRERADPPDKGEIYFEGTYREDAGKLYISSKFNNSNRLFDQAGEIIFEKVADYELPMKPSVYAHPGEVWHSVDPEITFNIDPEQTWRYRGNDPPYVINDILPRTSYHLGTYAKDSETKDVVICFNADGTAFEIFDRKDYQFVENEWKVVGRHPLFAGTCILSDVELRYKPIPPWRILNGYSEIVFTKMQK